MTERRNPYDIVQIGAAGVGLLLGAFAGALFGSLVVPGPGTVIGLLAGAYVGMRAVLAYQGN